MKNFLVDEDTNEPDVDDLAVMELGEEDDDIEDAPMKDYRSLKEPDEEEQDIEDWEPGEEDEWEDEMEEDIPDDEPDIPLSQEYEDLYGGSGENDSEMI